MGERTQLFIRIEDEDHKQIAGLVRYYQWGFGRVMLIDALNVAINLPFRSELALLEENTPYDTKNGQKVLTALQKEKHMSKPVLAYAFSKYINVLSRSIDDDMSPIGRNLDKYNSKTDAFRDWNHLFSYKKETILSQIKSKYDANIDNWYQYCDNNDGFMILTATYNGKNSHLANVKELKFDFFDVQYNKLTFHEYCQLNPEYTDSDFEKGFELITKNYNIKLN